MGKKLLVTYLVWSCIQCSAVASRRSALADQHLTFGLDTDIFVVDIAPIGEIIEYPGLTNVPMTKTFTRGVIKLRGAVVPVIDLSVRLGRQATEIVRCTCVIIIKINDEETGGHQSPGILVDYVNKVLEVLSGQIAPRPPSVWACMQNLSKPCSVTKEVSW